MFIRKYVRIPQLIAAGCLLLSRSVGAPPLTTIQDVLYKADGTRLNGVAVITWKSFESADSSNISMQSLTVRIVDGNLRVQLVPNVDATPSAPYKVKYNSDGKAQFEETWIVPASTKPLRLRDVRSAAPAQLESGTLPIQETDVINLPADLNARPVRGAGFAPGRAALIGASGAIEGVSGNSTDCVRVDGTAGPCGAPDFADITFVDDEVPGGVVDGANADFTLAAAPNPSTSLALYRNGMRMKPSFDYAATDRTVHFTSGAVPQPGDTLLASYRLPIVNPVRGGSAPQVLCSGTGQSTSATDLTSLAQCAIAAGTLSAGDRVEVQFDYAHTGTATGFRFAVRWGSTVMVQRDAGASDALVTGRNEAGVASDATQISVETWGTALPLGTALVSASDSTASVITIDFQGAMAAAGNESVALRHYTVVRYPAVS